MTGRTDEELTVITALAAQLHRLSCGDSADHEKCRRWNTTMGKNTHRDYYYDRAYSIYSQLEPEIGWANIGPAIEVILGEMS